MKRKLPLLVALVLSFSLMLATAANAAPGEVDSPERDPDDPIIIEDPDTPLDDGIDGEDASTTIDDLEVPLAGISSADIIIEAYSQVEVSVSEEQLLEAMETVRGGEQARIVLSQDGDPSVGTSVIIPTAALKGVVDEPYPSVAIYTDVGQVLMPNEVVASIVAQAEAADEVETVVFTMSKQSADEGQKLVGTDVALERIESGSVVELSIQSGSTAITGFGGAVATLSLAADDEIFAFGSNYAIIQSGTEYAGFCNLTETGLGVEIPITSTGAFVLLADALEEDSETIVASPLAARISNSDGDASNGSTPVNLAFACFAAAAVLSVGVVAVGISTSRKRRS